MTALAKERTSTPKKASGLDLPVAAGVKIWKGAWVVMAAGYVKPGTAATGLTMVGKAMDTVDNTGGADGAVTCAIDFLTEKTLFPFIGDAGNLFTQANMGTVAYLLDDQTATTVATGHTLIGIPWLIATANGVQTVLVEVGHG